MPNELARMAFLSKACIAQKNLSNKLVYEPCQERSPSPPIRTDPCLCECLVYIRMYSCSYAFFLCSPFRKGLAHHWIKRKWIVWPPELEGMTGCPRWGIECVVASASSKVSQRRGAVRGGGGRHISGMVAGQQSVVEQHPQINNDMYCSPIHSPYGEYYPGDNGHFYPHTLPPEMCPAHMCTVHGEYGMMSTNNNNNKFI